MSFSIYIHVWKEQTPVLYHPVTFIRSNSFLLKTILPSFISIIVSQLFSNSSVSYSSSFHIQFPSTFQFSGTFRLQFFVSRRSLFYLSLSCPNLGEFMDLLLNQAFDASVVCYLVHMVWLLYFSFGLSLQFHRPFTTPAYFTNRSFLPFRLSPPSIVCLCFFIFLLLYPSFFWSPFIWLPPCWKIYKWLSS